jgi:hypothetical protein
MVPKDTVEMTTAGSVGSGLVRPMMANPMTKEAEEFYRRWGMISFGARSSTLGDFANARTLSTEQVSELKEILNKRYSLIV